MVKMINMIYRLTNDLYTDDDVDTILNGEAWEVDLRDIMDKNVYFIKDGLVYYYDDLDNFEETESSLKSKYTEFDFEQDCVFDNMNVVFIKL